MNDSRVSRGRGRATRRWAIAFVIASWCSACRPWNPKPAVVTSAELRAYYMRAEHEEIMARMVEVEAMLDALAAADDAVVWRAKMDRLVVFFTVQVGELARWEEQSAYAMVDRWSAEARQLTKGLRHEHEIMQRWSAELDHLAGGDRPDARAFVRIAYGLLGLLRAHLETEDRVLAPLLEQTGWSVEHEMQRQAVPPGPTPAGD